tara:strand:+ start:1225 stop:1560 length:336 start_codon:yes stop_codon:yes gene_type:complete
MVQKAHKESGVSMTLGGWIELYMSKTGYSYRALADRIGVSHYSVRAWGRDVNLPRIDNIVMMCEVFGESLDRRPTQLVFEMLLYLPELKMADQRWLKRTNEGGIKNNNNNP